MSGRGGKRRNTLTSSFNGPRVVMMHGMPAPRPARPPAGCAAVVVWAIILGAGFGAAALVLRAIRNDALWPLALAAQRGDVAEVDALLKGGMDVNTPSNFHGWTGLHAAASAGHVRVVRLLLERG